MSLKQLDDCYSMGFIQEEEYNERRKALLAELEQESLQSSATYSAQSPLAALSQSGEFRFDGYDVRPAESALSGRVKANRKVKGIRIFVSSTFLDMKEERTLLVQNVFPELKRECRLRNINLVYVDFRWGITAEESAGGKVLDLCLNEIDKCRPYVIGVLGERYGWCQGSGIPDKALAQSFEVASQRFPWIESYTDRSVTELELLYGGLFFPKHAHGTFYYLRDPKYAESKGPEMREQNNSTEMKKLVDLKRRIQHAAKNDGANVRENYATPQQFADYVLKDLKEQIERDFPLSDAKEESALQKEQRYVDSFIEQKSKTFISRESELYQISQFIERKSKTPLMLFGQRGVGKSSLVARWIDLQRQNQTNSNNASSSSTYSSNDSSCKIFYSFFGLIHRQSHKNISFIMNALKTELGLDKEVPSEPGEVLHSLKEWLQLASEKEKKIVLILDGFDKLDCESLLWLPKEFPVNVRVIMTCSPNNKYYNYFTNRDLKWNEYVIEVNPLVDVDKRLLIERYLTQQSKKLSYYQTHEILGAKLSDNPLFLSGLLQRLVMCGEFQNLDKYISNYVRFNTLEQFFKECLQEINEQCAVPNNKYFVYDVLRLIAISRYGMVEAELVSIMKIYSQIPWSSLFASLGDIINYHDGLINFSNSMFKDIVLQQLDDREIESYRKKIIDFFKSKALNERKIQEYPYHLLKMEDATELAAFLSSDITIMTSLYTPLTKYDLFAYLKCSRLSDDATVFVRALDAYQRKVSQQEYAHTSHKVANFLIENGNNDIAAKLFSNCLPIFLQLFSENSLQVSELIFDYARLLVQAAKYDEAAGLIERCLKIRLPLYSSEHIKYAEVLWLKAFLHKKKGEYDDAIKVYEQALGIAEKKLGSNHPQTALYMKTIADVYRLQSNYTRAEAMYRDALFVNRSNYGDLHATVAECLDGLGKILKKVAKYTEAYAFYNEALSIFESLYGENHVSVAEACSDLADVERKLSHITEAEQLYLRAKKIYENQYGTNHPEVAEVSNNLGILYKNTGRLVEAQSIIEEGLNIIEKTLGAEHIKAARFLNNAADIHAICSRFQVAKEMYVRALRINERLLGKDHPEVSENLCSIGKLEKKRGNYLEAQKCYQRAQEIIKVVFGEAHPKYAFILNDLGTVYRKVKRMDDAWNNYSIAKDICEKEFGAESPEVAMNLNGLARVLLSKGEDLDDGEKYHQRALDIYERTLGRTNQRVAYTLNLIGELYAKQGKFGTDEADRYFIRALEMNRELFGNEHPEVAENLFGLAGVQIGQLNYSKAEATLKESIGITERMLGKSHPHSVGRWAALAELYERMGRVEDSIKTWEYQKQIKEARRLEEAAWK